MQCNIFVTLPQPMDYVYNVIIGLRTIHNSIVPFSLCTRHHRADNNIEDIDPVPLFDSRLLRCP